ncbi:MAG: hypothetical protein U5J63_06330 [Fodinibius sp.]|nr:hypothetical protein [Fodinibius sp.]
MWNIVSTIISERQQREVAPIRENLNSTLELFDEKDALTDKEANFRERIENFTEFLEMFERFTDALLPYINEKNLKFLKHLVKLAEMKHTITGSGSESEQSADHHE